MPILPALTREICLGLVRLFYTQLRMGHAENVPQKGPAMVVANHPNGLLDPLVLRIGLQRPVHFLGKSTLFANPLGRLAMAAFGGIPVYRAKDGQDTQQNDKTFDLCRAHLAQNGWLALFPEGTSHSDPSLKRLKTGAARIALSYAQNADGTIRDLTIIPAGLLYEDKATFRTAVAVTAAKPIDVAAFVRQHGSDFAAAQLLTDKIHESLKDVCLQAQSDELWRGLLAVAAWTDADAAADLIVRQARAHELAAAWHALDSENPEQAQAVVEQVRQYVRALQSIGVADPLQLETPLRLNRQQWLGFIAPIVLLWPLALIGLALGWTTYAAIRPLPPRLAKGETDVISTIKVLLGLLAFTLTYVTEALIAAFFFGWTVGLAAFVVAPLCGFVALRFSERVELRRRTLRAAWLRLADADIVNEIGNRRRELATTVANALSRTTRAQTTAADQPAAAAN